MYYILYIIYYILYIVYYILYIMLAITCVCIVNVNYLIIYYGSRTSILYTLMQCVIGIW